MDKTEILNAQIVSTKLGEDHGCLTANLSIKGAGWGCTFGGYCLDHWCAKVGEYHSSDGYGAIVELMKTLGVESWEELKGKYVRVEIETYASGKILKIGHFMKNQWFSFKEYFEQVKDLDKTEA
nr:MAG TPA: hypothetical protein [Caudoviricetes sp.]